jgi:hypothetical protein
MAACLQTAFPDLLDEVRRLLIESGRAELAAQVDQLVVVDRCRCGDPECATFYTAPPPRDGWGAGHENVVLDAAGADIVLDVVHGKIVCVEVVRHDQRGQSSPKDGA